jgi:hypothetical protein
VVAVAGQAAGARLQTAEELRRVAEGPPVVAMAMLAAGQILVQADLQIPAQADRAALTR